MKLVIGICVLFFILPMRIVAQQDVQNYHFKKGEVLDILLLSAHSNSTELFDRYKKTAFPVAFKYSYTPIPGFGIKALTLGNHLPSSFIFGKWESLKKREGFLTNITREVPDFHQQRRDIFSFFGLTYYEMAEETEFSISKSKFNVVTAFWQKDASSFTDFLFSWKKRIKKAGAKIVIQLHNGTSPLGYHYDPDILLIVQWEDERSFHTFAEQYPLASYAPLENVHQFVLE